jgi:hypothetical protein
MKFITTKTEEGKHEVFLFPRLVHHDAMAEMLEAIKTEINGKKDWVFRRPISAGFIDKNLDCHGVSETLNLKSRQKNDTLLLRRQLCTSKDSPTPLVMCFITTETKEGKKDVFVFPSDIDHVDMAEVLNNIKDKTHGMWTRIRRKPISAGFVDKDLNCYGRSNTLGLDSSSHDSDLLAIQIAQS